MARPRSKTRRTVAGWNCDADLLERLESIPNRSRFINRVLRDYFRMPLIPEAEEHIMASNQKIRNLDMILGHMAIHKFSQRGPLERRIELECGVTNKKANEYLDLLIMDGKLTRSGQYIILSGWKPENHPYPGTEDYIRWKCNQEMAALRERSAAKQIQLDPNEEAVLNATREQKPILHEHKNKPFACKVCAKQACIDCASNYEEQPGSTPTGTCKNCG